MPSLSSLFLAGAVLLTSAAPAAAFSRLITFGDGFVDTGNTFGQTGIPAAPYFEGRFSNGPLWDDYVAADLDIPLTNFGFGGASSETIGGFLFDLQLIDFVPGLRSQVDTYTATGVDPDALYGLWVGANDYLFLGVDDPTGPVANIMAAVNQLSEAGAQHFLLLNLPNLGNLPVNDRLGASAADKAVLNTVTATHNQQLAAAVETSMGDGILSIRLVDVNTLFNQTGALDIINTTDACLATPICAAEPNRQATFLFWDESHPSTAVHRIIADVAIAQVSARTVPEPTRLWGLLWLGLWPLKSRR